MTLRSVWCFLVIFSPVFASTPSITIREFQPRTDTKNIVALIKKEWHKLFLLPSYDEAIIQRMFVQKKPGDTSAAKAKLMVKVIEIEGIFAGFVTFFAKDESVAQIELLAIDQAHRGKGLGKLLIDHVSDLFRMSGHTFLQLYVYTSNSDALKFYKHLDFKLKNHFGHYQLFGKNI